MIQATVKHFNASGNKKMVALLDSMMPVNREYLSVTIKVQNDGFFAQSAVGPASSDVVALQAPRPSGKIRIPERGEKTSPLLIPAKLWCVLALENQVDENINGVLSFNKRSLRPDGQSAKTTVLAKIPLNAKECNGDQIVSFFSSDMTRVLQILGGFRLFDVWTVLFIESPDRWGLTVRKEGREILFLSPFNDSLVIWHNDCMHIKFSLSNHQELCKLITPPPSFDAYGWISRCATTVAHWMIDNANMFSEITGRVPPGVPLRWPIVCKRSDNWDSMFACVQNNNHPGR